MFKNIFLKSIYEKRWSTLSWSLAIIAMTMLTTLLFPTFRDTFGASFQEIPESMKAFFGDVSTYQTLGGFVDVQVVGQMVFLTLIMAVIMGSGFIAGDEGEGTLQTLLAQPIKRSVVYFQKFIALSVLLAIASGMIFISVLISGLLINESMDWWRMAQSTFGVWLITMAFGAAAYSLGAFTGKRGLSGSIIGLVAFLSYMITSLAVGIDALKKVDVLSPFHYFNTPSIIKFGLDWGNVSVLLSIVTVVIVLGYIRFIRRDIR